MGSGKSALRGGRGWPASSLASRRLLAAGTAGVVVVVVAAVLVVRMLAGGGPQPRARVYGAFSACLLTDSGGVAGGSAKAAWSGMEQASLVTHVKVSYLAVAGAATAGDAAPYLASLVVRHCNLIVAAGVAQAAAANADAGRFGSVRFVVIGARATRSNVMAVNVPAAQTGSAVGGLVGSAARSAAG